MSLFTSIAYESTIDTSSGEAKLLVQTATKDTHLDQISVTFTNSDGTPSRFTISLNMARKICVENPSLVGRIFWDSLSQQYLRKEIEEMKKGIKAVVEKIPEHK